MGHGNDDFRGSPNRVRYSVPGGPNISVPGGPKYISSRGPQIYQFQGAQIYQFQGTQIYQFQGGPNISVPGGPNIYTCGFVAVSYAEESVLVRPGLDGNCITQGTEEQRYTIVYDQSRLLVSYYMHDCI